MRTGVALHRKFPYVTTSLLVPWRYPDCPCLRQHHNQDRILRQFWKSVKKSHQYSFIERKRMLRYVVSCHIMLWRITQRCVVLRDVIVRFVMLRDWHISSHTKYNKQGKRTKKPHTQLVSVKCPVLCGYFKLHEQQRTLSKAGGRQGVKACDNKLRDGRGREAGLESWWRATVDWRKMQIAFVSEPSIAKHKTFKGLWKVHCSS